LVAAPGAAPRVPETVCPSHDVSLTAWLGTVPVRRCTNYPQGANDIARIRRESGSVVSIIDTLR
jgi:hypothetical protein